MDLRTGRMKLQWVSKDFSMTLQQPRLFRVLFSKLAWFSSFFAQAVVVAIKNKKISLSW